MPNFKIRADASPRTIDNAARAGRSALLSGQPFEVIVLLRARETAQHAREAIDSIAQKLPGFHREVIEQPQLVRCRFVNRSAPPDTAGARVPAPSGDPAPGTAAALAIPRKA